MVLLVKCQTTRVVSSIPVQYLPVPRTRLVLVTRGPCPAIGCYTKSGRAITFRN